MRANYSIVEAIAGQHVTILDVGPWDQFQSVTNAAELVVEDLYRKGVLKPGERLFYFDSGGRLDEILIANGRFAGFAPGPRA